LNTEDGEDESDFSHLPAHALYFYDPADNIVELLYCTIPGNRVKGKPFSK